MERYEGAVRALQFSDPIVYVDHGAAGRSGHMSHAMVEYAPGKILDFNSNCSAERFWGHSAFGWVEYRYSEDGGETFGEPHIFPYSWEELLKGMHTISVEKAVACSDGSIVAICLVNSQERTVCCEPWDIPMVVRSTDAGKTWGEPEPLSLYPGRVYDACVHDGAIYVLEFCNPAEMPACNFTGHAPEHVYRLYQSDDNGKTFYEKSVVGFPSTEGRGYGNMIFTPEGKLIVYAYNVNCETQLDYCISDDGGKTWVESGSSYVEKKIRNPQVGLLDGQFILHGRGGSNETGYSIFALYTSKDGIHWDHGFEFGPPRDACYYSNNLTVKGADGKSRMLVQYSQNVYAMEQKMHSCQVNVMHRWIENA